MDHPGWTCRRGAFVFLDKTPRLLKKGKIVRYQRCSVSQDGRQLDCDKTKTTVKPLFDKKLKADNCNGRFKDVYVDLM